MTAMHVNDIRGVLKRRFPEQVVWCKVYGSSKSGTKFQIWRKPRNGIENGTAISIVCNNEEKAWNDAYTRTKPQD